MTQTFQVPRVSATKAPDRPHRLHSIPRRTWIEVGGSVLAAVCLVWITFTVVALAVPVLALLVERLR